MLVTAAEHELVAACQVLFGPEVAVSRDFLAIMQLSGVKDAFRRRARETHPDLHPADPAIQQRQSYLFHQVSIAYSRLATFCSQRTRFAEAPVNAKNRGASAAASESAPSAGAPREDGHYYSGVLPPRQMPLGRYLYCRRIIPYHVLLDSLTWQRRQRPKIGHLAREWGWLDEQQVSKVLVAGARLGRFGERAYQLGLLSEAQVRQLLLQQRSSQQRIGEYYVASGYLTRRQLAALVAEMRRHNQMIANS